MSLLDDARANRIAARFGRTVAIEWNQPRDSEGGWISYPDFEPGEAQTCPSVACLIHDDCIKILARSAMLVGDEDVRMSGIVEMCGADCALEERSD